MALKTTLVADSIHGNMQISYLEKEIMSTQAFNRLHNINQNSSIYLTFPSNRTRRFEHSVGSMYLAGEMFFYSIVNAEQGIRNELLDKVLEEIKRIRNTNAKTIRMLLGDNEELPSVMEKDPLYSLYVPNVVQSKHAFAFALIFQSVRCAALLHDLGHPPFSHIAEAALEKIWESVLAVEKEKRTARQNHFIETMSYYLVEDGIEDSPVFALHEKVGNCIADRLFEAIIRDTEDLEYKFFLFMVHSFVNSILTEENTFYKNIHGLIAGSIDSDRLDYIVRDLNNSGFNHGRIEYDRLISSMKLIKHRDDFLFCSDIRALSTIEDFFNKRMRLYKYVIFHHRVVKTDNLLKRIIVKLANDYLENQESEDLVESQVLPLDISGLWKAVK
ncbi:MAG: HD domain-containing protein, partial [Bacillota bacterium]|nr:HD domain-containing protein [Bacillota bacterium]